jgi:hypothetical protein
MAELDAWLKGQREQALIAFGDPDMAGAGEIDPALRELIEKNYGSGNAVLARLRHQRDVNRRAILNRLAGRGLVGSGDTGYLEGENARESGNMEYDARNRLLAALTGFQQNYVDRKMSLRSAVLQAYQQAYYNYMQNPELYQGTFGGGGGSGGGGGGWQFWNAGGGS